MSKESKEVSVIIPTARNNSLVISSIRSVCESLNNFRGNKELILCLNRPISQKDKLLNNLTQYKFIKVFIDEKPQGSVYVRELGIKKARFRVLLFTDDDSIVEPTWVNRMYKNVIRHGACAGNIEALDKTNLICKFEEYIDYYRIRASDSKGNVKFISFPNFGIKKTLLPSKLFFTCPQNTVEDIDLACRLRLNKINITLNENLFVKTAYPDRLSSVIKRKLKHAKGIAFLGRKYGRETWWRLEIGSNRNIIQRWVLMSFKAPFSFYERCLFLIINLIYCLGLFYFSFTFRNIQEERIKNVGL